MEKNVKAELLVVDDHSLILEGICKIVNKMPEVTVADAVTSGKQAIKLICFSGSFAGVIVELLWCLLRNGYLESRSGLVYGPFNLLYGAGATALTLALYRFRNRNSWISFLGGFLVGSAVEYACSWGQEMIFGSCSWDYSKYREGLYPLEPLTKEDAENALDIIGRFQNEMYERFGTHFVHASDEFYLLANRPLPPEEVYDGYVQLENGVGMLRLLIEETDYTLEALSGDERVHTLSLATGKLAYPFLKDIAAKVHEKFPNVNITVYEILNDFFGHGVTVSGLITGQDLIKQLKGKPLGEVLLLPANMFRSNEEVFLDDLTKQDVEKALQVPINIVKSDGQELIRAMLMEESEETKQFHSPYEL